MKKGKGRPSKTDTPQEVTLNWKTFDVKPPHGEIVYVKGKNTIGNRYVERLGNDYFHKCLTVDVKEFTHWRLIY